MSKNIQNTWNMYHFHHFKYCFYLLVMKASAYQRNGSVMFRDKMIYWLSNDWSKYDRVVRWDGLEEVANSWEPMMKLLKGIPKKLERFCEDKSSEVKKHMASLLRTNEEPATTKNHKRGRLSVSAAPWTGIVHKQLSRRIRLRGT